MDRDTALEQALAHALKENKENKEEIERLKDLVKESETGEQEDDQELCWRDIYMSFNDGEGWINFSRRMSKHFKLTRK